jgi:hypothetical protein
MTTAIDPPNDSPDTFGIGDAACRCGGIKFTNTTGHHALTFTVVCPTCGDHVEVAPDAE